MPSEYRLILKYADQPGYTPDIDCYLRHGGYEMLKKALALQAREFPGGKKMSPQEQIRDEVFKSGLRGRGGAGFSCGLKWSFVDRKSGKPIYLICNADESEPGTFKDRQIIHKDPHQLLEGMIISCWANDVKLAYIYIRGEFVEGAKILQCAIGEAREKNFLGKNILGSGCDLEIYVQAEGLARNEKDLCGGKRLKTSGAYFQLIVIGFCVHELVIAIAISRGFASRILVGVGELNTCPGHNRSGIISHRA